MNKEKIRSTLHKLWKILKTPQGMGVLALIFLFVVYKCYGGYTKHARHSKEFSLVKITSRLSYNSSWNVKYTSLEKKEVAHILDQPFFFLGKGKQVYAFESADGKYVLKFLQHQRFKVDEAVLPQLKKTTLNKKLTQSKKKQKAGKRDELFESFLIAGSKIPQDTGVIFLHLNRTKKEFGTLEILDKKGSVHTVKLDDVQFILQRRADLVKPTIVKLMYEGQKESAKKHIAEIFDLMVTTAKAGIVDRDGALIRNDNLGFLDGHAIFIDTGKLTESKEIAIRSVFQHNLRRLDPLYKWLKKSYPDLADYFAEQKKKAIDSF